MIFNTKSNKTINIDNFNNKESNFRLRPRQLLFSKKFSL